MPVGDIDPSRPYTVLQVTEDREPISEIIGRFASLEEARGFLKATRRVESHYAVYLGTNRVWPDPNARPRS